MARQETGLKGLWSVLALGLVLSGCATMKEGLQDAENFNFQRAQQRKNELPKKYDLPDVWEYPVCRF